MEEVKESELVRAGGMTDRLLTLPPLLQDTTGQRRHQAIRLMDMHLAVHECRLLNASAGLVAYPLLLWLRRPWWRSGESVEALLSAFAGPPTTVQ